MTSERYYREEATRCRERAAVSSRDSANRRHWLELAEECDQLRDAFHASSPQAAASNRY
jgi:hypothetical protein